MVAAYRPPKVALDPSLPVRMVIVPTAVGATVVLQPVLVNAVRREELQPSAVDLHRPDVPSAVFVWGRLTESATLLRQHPAKQGNRDLILP